MSKNQQQAAAPQQVPVVGIYMACSPDPAKFNEQCAEALADGFFPGGEYRVHHLTNSVEFIQLFIKVDKLSLTTNVNDGDPEKVESMELVHTDDVKAFNKRCAKLFASGYKAMIPAAARACPDAIDKEKSRIFFTAVMGKYVQSKILTPNAGLVN